MNLFAQRAVIVVSLAFVIFAWITLSPLKFEATVTSFAVQSARVLLAVGFVAIVSRVLGKRVA